MKPPSRHRITPSRFESLKRSETNHMLGNGWSQQEKRNLLRGLKRQKMINSELSLMELRKKVPKHSLPEIQNLIKSLKTSVVQRVHHQVQRQRREVQRTKVPTEMWAELAQRMTGIHEDTISSAFSQVLVIAATEPCNLQHSNTPKSTESPATVAKNKCTVPRQNMPRSNPATGQNCTSPSERMTSGLSCRKSLKSPCIDVTSASSVQNTSLIPSSAVPEKESSTPNTPKTHPHWHASCKNQSLSSPKPLQKSTLCAVSVAGSPASHSNQLIQQADNGRSGQNCKHRKVDTVDFEKIYHFLSKNNSKNCNLPLTEMESAVLLDLLMSLPEELPLLNCVELQHHLLQVHTRLTTPAAVFCPNNGNIPAASKPVLSVNLATNQPPTLNQLKKDVSSQPQSLAAEEHKTVELPSAAGDVSSQSSTIKQNGKIDWTAAGLCPLNPFMVPVALLKRQ